MNIRAPIAFYIITAHCLATEDDAVVRFSNGDRLTGELISLSGDRLVWKSQLLAEASEFTLKHVVDLNISSGQPAKEEPVGDHKAILEMTNGDVIEGRLAGLEENEIKLTTSYAGDLTIPRVNVTSVGIFRNSHLIYRGPVSLEGWTISGAGSWQYRGGSLHSNSPGGIAREVDLPDECVIAFDAAWRGEFRPRIVLFSDDVTSQNPANGYEMVFQGNSVHVKKSGSEKWIGHSPNAGVLRENEKARIEIKASKKSGKILLYIDDELIDLWEDVEMAETKFGNGLHFIAQDSSMLKISQIEISEWDGYHENVPNRQVGLGGRAFRGRFDFADEDHKEEKREEEHKDGRMVLVNGDTIEGDVVAIDGDNITLKTQFSDVTFPIIRLKNILLKKADMETVKLYKEDVRATFDDGSRLVFRFDGVDGDKILGFSQHFGNASFSKGSFRRIEFNIYDKEMDFLRLDDGW